MTDPTPFQILNATISYRLTGLPYKRRTRLAILSQWSERRQPLKTSKELTPYEIEHMLTCYFAEWPIPRAIPTEQEQARIRRMAENFSASFVAMFGLPHNDPPPTPEVKRARRKAKKARYKANKAARTKVRS